MAKEFNMEYIYNHGFGIEIEMTGITREKAATVAQALIGGTVRHIGGTYDEWCLVAPDGRKWKFVYRVIWQQRTDRKYVICVKSHHLKVVRCWHLLSLVVTTALR